MADLFAASALLVPSAPPDGKSGGVGVASMKPDYEIEDQSSGNEGRGSECEGKRPDDLISLMKGGAGEKDPAVVNKHVNFTNTPVNDGKRTSLLTTDGAPIKMFCCAELGPNDALPRWCCEALDGEGKCRFTSHSALPKADVRPSCRYIMALKKGRGGASCYLDKWIDEKDLDDADRERLNELPPRPVNEWTDEFHACQVSRVMGGATTSESKRRLFTDTKQTFKLACTPQRKQASDPGKKEEGMTILSTPESWDTLEGELALADPVVTFQTGLTSNSGNTTEVSTEAGFNDCNINFKQITTSIQEIRDHVSGRFKDAIDKTNHLALSQHKIQATMGTKIQVDEDGEFDTIFENLSFLKDQIHNCLFRIKAEEEKLAKVAENGDKLGTKLLSLSEEVKTVELDARKADDALTTSVSNKESLTKSLETLQEKFMVPMKKFYEAYEMKDSSGKTVLERFETLERSVQRSDRQGDLFGSFSMGTPGGETGSDLNALRTRMDALEAENSKLRSRLTNVEVVAPGGGGRDNNESDDEYKRLYDQLLLRVVTLEDAKGPGINVAGYLFGGVTDCERFLRTQVPEMEGEDMVFFMNDMIAMVHAVPKQDGGTSLEGLLARDHHANKGGFTSLSAAQAYSSAQQSVPGPLAGSKDHPIPAIDKFERWDRQDGIKGLRYEINDGVDHRNAALLAVLQRKCQAPAAFAVFSHINARAPIHWRHLGSFVSDTRHACYQQCQDEKEAWLYPCEVMRGVFDECFKLRNVGAERSSMQSFTTSDAARLMWGMLRSHDIMEDFIRHNFIGHPKLTGYSIKHLFRNRVTPHSLGIVKGELSKHTRDIKALNARLPTGRRVGGGGGGGGRGGGTNRDGDTGGEE